MLNPSSKKIPKIDYSIDNKLKVRESIKLRLK